MYVCENKRSPKMSRTGPIGDTVTMVTDCEGWRSRRLDKSHFFSDWEIVVYGSLADCGPSKASVFNILNRPGGWTLTHEPLLNDAEAARFLGGLHPKTVQRMARRGELPHYRIGKYYRYRASELSEWLVLHSSGQNNPPAQFRKEIQ